jgi:hypothetical protein
VNRSHDQKTVGDGIIHHAEQVTGNVAMMRGYATEDILDCHKTAELFD